jgi:hypothetical protein
LVVARLEGHDERRTFRAASSDFQRRDFRVILTGGLVERLGNHFVGARALDDDEAPNVRIRRRVAVLSERDGTGHQFGIE